MGVSLAEKAAEVRHSWKRWAAALRGRNTQIVYQRVWREIEGQPEAVVIGVSSILHGQLEAIGISGKDYYADQLKQERDRKKMDKGTD